MHRWIPLLISLAIALAAPTLVAAAQPAEVGTLTEQPLRSVGCGVTIAGMPALEIVSLPEGYWGPAEIAAVDHGSDPAWAGEWPEDVGLDHVIARATGQKGEATFPFDDQDTVALISAEGRFRPLDLQRRGNRFSIRCDAIPFPASERDIPQRKKREVHAVSLGRLPAGAYVMDIAFECRVLEPSGALYAWQKSACGTTAFTVWKPFTDNHRADPGRPVRIMDAQLISPPQSASPERPPWQLPRALALAYGGDRPSGLFGVGPIDLMAFGKEPVATPIMPFGGKGHQVAIILGPELNSGEWMRLRSVVAVKGEWTVTVETWRDDGPRRKNLQHRELLAVPIDSDADLPVPPKVVTRWRRLRAPDQGGGYIDQPEAVVPQPGVKGGGPAAGFDGGPAKGLARPDPPPAAPAKPSTDF